MEVSFAEKLGTEDRQILAVLIENGELELKLNKPESLGWQELIYFIKYIVADALSKESELSTGDIFQWLGSQGYVADEVEKTAADILADARQKRIQEMMQNEQLRLDRVDR